MAIREVLVSFTFEQQRQMLNLIGADVGDASLLLTPTNVVVTAINEIITGDVDLSNQTIGMDDGTLASPSLFWDAGQGFYKVDANKLGLTTSLAVTGNLEVDGDITFRAGSGTGGTLTFGDLDTDNIVINADIQSSIVPDSTANYNLGSLNKQWNNLWIDGTASIDTLEVDLNSTLTGNLAVNSGIIKVDPSTVTTATIFNDYITTAQVLMDATSITLGSDSVGTLLIRNGTINTPQSTINVFNTTATTVNAFSAASNVTTGLSTFGSTGVNSNFNIRSDDTILDGDLNVNGGEILSSENTFDLLINNNDVRIGASNGVGETIINNSLKVTENVNLANSGTNITIKDNTANSLVIKEGANTYITFQTTDSSERVIVYKDLYVVGNLDISGTSTVIDTTTLTVEDKNIELGTSGSPSDAAADGGGITLKGDTDKTITYNNTSGFWETNIGLKVTGNIESTGEVTVGDDSTNTYTKLYDGTGGVRIFRAASNSEGLGLYDPSGAKISLAMDGSGTFAGTLTSNGITQYTLPTIGNGGQLGYDDGTKSLRLYANSSTNADAKIQFHFNQSGTASMTFDQGGAMEFPGQTDTAATGATTSGTGLAHYEEGTWTPDFLGLSSAFTSYYNKKGTYVRIGSMCHIHGFIQLNGTPAFTDPNDLLMLGPLPFNYSNQNGGYLVTVGGVACQNFNFHDNDYSNTGQVACGISNDSGTSYVVFQVCGNNNVRGVVQNSAIGSTNCIIEFELSYRV